MVWFAEPITINGDTGYFTPYGVVINTQRAVILDQLVKLVKFCGVTGVNLDTGRISVGQLDAPLP